MGVCAAFANVSGAGQCAIGVALCIQASIIHVFDDPGGSPPPPPAGGFCRALLNQLLTKKGFQTAISLLFAGKQLSIIDSCEPNFIKIFSKKTTLKL